MPSDIPLDLYKVFYEVVVSGNMSNAAKKLYISQPAVSMAIRQLESKLGGTLLIRTPKGVRTTSEGKVLFTYIEQGLNLIDTAEKKYYELLNLDAGEIKIGASDNILNSFMMPYLEQYNRNFPDISIKITNRTTYGTLNILRKGEIDMGFINLPIDIEDDIFNVYNCMEISDILIGGTKYKDMAKSGLKIKDLPNYPVMLLEKDNNSRKLIESFLLSKGVVLNPIFQLGTTEILINFVKKNWGLTFVTKELEKNLTDDGLVSIIPLDEPLPKRHIGLVRLKDVEISRASSRFANMFINKKE